jgi:hypothetical protein
LSFGADNQIFVWPVLWGWCPHFIRPVCPVALITRFLSCVSCLVALMTRFLTGQSCCGAEEQIVG